MRGPVPTGCRSSRLDRLLLNEAWLRPNETRISCEGARGSRRASSQQYQARRLPPQERALGSCMRWLGCRFLEDRKSALNREAAFRTAS